VVTFFSICGRSPTHSAVSSPLPEIFYPTNLPYTGFLLIKVPPLSLLAPMPRPSAYLPHRLSHNSTKCGAHFPSSYSASLTPPLAFCRTSLNPLVLRGQSRHQPYHVDWMPSEVTGSEPGSLKSSLGRAESCYAQLLSYPSSWSKFAVQRAQSGVTVRCREAVRPISPYMTQGLKI